jgi:hypothetical protein
MGNRLLRIIAYVLVVGLSLEGPNPLDFLNGATGPGGVAAYREEALAPAAGGALNCLDQIRAGITRQYELLLSMLQRNPPGGESALGEGGRLPAPGLPRYAGAGETSIHKAIRQAQEWLAQGKHLESMILLEELRDDLIRARETEEIDALMNKWNARFPSDLEVDVIAAPHLDEFVNEVRTLLESIPEPAESLEDARFEAWLLEAVKLGLWRATEKIGYDSLADMVRDYMDAGKVETILTVDVAEPLREIFGGMAEIKVAVTGFPTVANIIFELEKQHTMLLGQPWALRIEPDVDSSSDLVLPSQKLTLTVSPSGGSKQVGFGPIHQSVWAAPILLSIWHYGSSVWLSLTVVVAAVGATLFGMLNDPAFCRSTTARMSPLPRSS